MAATEKTAEETAAHAPAAHAAAAGVKALLPLILSVALMPVIAFAMTKFVLIPQLQKGLVVKAATPGERAKAGEHGEKSRKEGAGAKRENVEMTKLLVNVAGTMGARFLMVSLSVAGTGGEEFKTKMEEHKAQLKDMTMSTLATKTIADLEKPNARNLIRTELMAGFNNILGDALVQEIYFTDFAIQ